MNLQAAMLRGVNLGKRQVVMSELRAACEKSGLKNVKTLLASGNLVIESKFKGERLENFLEVTIKAELGLETDVYVRTSAQLEAIVAANPFEAFARATPSYYVVYFMRASASADELEAMEKTALFGEEWKQGGACMYVKFPKGQGVSKLKLPKLGTARNWNTVGKLVAMTAPA